MGNNSGQPLEPLAFQSIFKEVVWGGRRLATTLGKSLPPTRPIGESWELVDLTRDQSVVARGPHAGKTLEQLVQTMPEALLGPTRLDGGRFPLLVKFIDAAETLSVQVHPDAHVAARLGGRPKSEAWVILDAAPGAALYLGVRDGVSRDELRRAIADDRLADLLVRVEPKVGDLVPVRPGTIHAIGGGVLLAEVQQPSDTTYRLYDWGRCGLDGKPRQLHLQEALESTDLTARPVIGGTAYDAETFSLKIVDLSSSSAPVALPSAGAVVLIVLAGKVLLRRGDSSPTNMNFGDVLLVPHCFRPAEISANGPGRIMIVSFKT